MVLITILVITTLIILLIAYLKRVLNKQEKKSERDKPINQNPPTRIRSTFIPPSYPQSNTSSWNKNRRQNKDDSDINTGNQIFDSIPTNISEPEDSHDRFTGGGGDFSGGGATGSFGDSNDNSMSSSDSYDSSSSSND